MRALVALGGLSLLLASGCTGGNMKSPVDGGTGDGSAGGAPSDGGLTDGGPVDGGTADGGTPIPFITQSWTVDPGTSDLYRCTQVKLDSDVTITGFSNASSGSNFRTFVTAGTTPMNPVDGDFYCTIGNLYLRLLYAFGPETGAIEFPPDVGIHLKAGQYVVMTVALQNQGTTPISGQTSVSIRTEGASSAIHEAELILAGTTKLSIPSDGQNHSVTGGCAAQSASQVFGAWPTMNRLGVHQTLRLNGQAILDTDFMVDQQPIHLLSLALSQGDQVLLTCSYFNQTGATVIWGSSYSDEVCFLGVYRYSLDSTLGNLYECVSH
jgi:hypothetical protein